MNPDVPINRAENGGRDPATGRFMPGHGGGPGRPRGSDLRSLVAEHRASTMEEALLRVYDMLVERAIGGDVAAARLLLDRLCAPLRGESASMTLHVVTGVPGSE